MSNKFALDWRVCTNRSPTFFNTGFRNVMVPSFRFVGVLKAGGGGVVVLSEESVHGVLGFH